jgi:A/G-specific adenine glycosylase
VYASFIARFPNPSRLASASLQSLEHELRPLGLAYRAHRLLRAGRTLVKRFDGAVPRTESQLLELLGVGKYIARAVMCFAFGEQISLVDSNVVRIVGRVFSLDTRRGGCGGLWMISCQEDAPESSISP